MPKLNENWYDNFKVFEIDEHLHGFKKKQDGTR